MMPEADEELYFVIDEKQNQVELTEKGIATLTANMEDDQFFTMPDVPSTLVEIDASEASDAVKQEQREALVPRAGHQVSPFAHHEPVAQVVCACSKRTSIMW